MHWGVQSSKEFPLAAMTAICHYDSTSFLRLSQTCPQNIPKQKEQKVEENPEYSGRQSRFSLVSTELQAYFLCDAGDTNSGLDVVLYFVLCMSVLPARMPVHHVYA